MSEIVLSIFSKKEDADEAINQLRNSGYDARNISVIMKSRKDAVDMAKETGANVAGGTVSGGITGGVIGGITGLLIGIGAITVPGLGALLIGGPIASALGLSGAAATAVSGAATGALAGGIIGALANLGVPEDAARAYEERVKAGDILIAIPARDKTETEIKQILVENGAEQIKTFAMKE